MSSHSRTIPKGRFGRAARLAVSSLFTGVAPLALLVDPVSTSLHPVVVWVCIIFVTITAWLWLRLFFTGPRVSGDCFVVNSWWWRRTVCRDEVIRFRVGSYGGPFYYLAWAIDDGRLRSGELQAELIDGSIIRLPGTVCNYRIAREMAEASNSWLGVELGSGNGPRRRANA